MRTEWMLAVRYLRTRKLRSALTTLAIMLGIMLMVALNGMIPPMERAFTKNLTATAGDADMTIAMKTGSFYPQAATEALRHAADVDAASWILKRTVALSPENSLPALSGKTVTSLTVVGMEADRFLSLHAMKMESGQWLSRQGGVMLSEDLAQALGLKAGDSLKVPAAKGMADLQVTGILMKNPQVGINEIWVSVVDAQKILGVEGQTLITELRFRPGTDVNAAKTRIMQGLGDGFADHAAASGSTFGNTIKLTKQLFLAFGVISLIMGAFIIFVTFRTLVAERRRDIGLLRAVGMSGRGVVRVVLFESLIQGVAGALLGVATGMLLVAGLLQLFRPYWNQFVREPLGSAEFSPSTLVMALALGLITTILGGVLPAMGAAGISPLEAMRPVGTGSQGIRRTRMIAGMILLIASPLTLISQDVTVTFTGVTVFLVGLGIAGPVLIQPVTTLFGKLFRFIFMAEGQIAEGNVCQQPRRASATVMTVTIGMALLVSMAGMVTSLQGALTGYLNKSMGSDYLVTSPSIILSSGNVGAPPELLREIRKTEGVSAATGIRVSMSVAGTENVQVLGLETDVYPELSGLMFSKGDDSAWAELKKGDACIINGVYATQQKIRMGDQLPVETLSGVKKYRVAAIGNDILNAKINSVYLDQAEMQKSFGNTNDVMLMINRKPDTDSGKVFQNLKTVTDQYPSMQLTNATDFKASIEKDTVGAFGFFYVLLLLLIIPSLIALVNTLSIAVLERTRELGVLRAVGALRRQLKKMITAESLLLSALGVFFGLVSGIWMGKVLVDMLAVSGFPMPWSFPWSGVFLALGAGLVFGLIGARMPARYASRLDVIRALQYE